MPALRAPAGREPFPASALHAPFPAAVSATQHWPGLFADHQIFRLRIGPLFNPLSNLSLAVKSVYMHLLGDAQYSGIRCAGTCNHFHLAMSGLD
jgi:hypothetical protein